MAKTDSAQHTDQGPILVDLRRRALLRAGVAGATLFAPVPWATVWAQSEGALRLLRAPKVALVIGNSAYSGAPLRNPANDARAIGAGLQQSGFDVTTKLDAGRDEMNAAVEAYVRTLQQKRSVGVFYFAGHGLQLAWRNFMLPVNASIDAVTAVPQQGVDVARLMQGIAAAGNPFNLVILDACRDNPFGSLKGIDQKGLSQMDAPPGTLLAYATAPGNVASDGEGANGLYTEHLIREMKVPEAKVEDVFKRVRLGVRRRSNGQQVPWESTSLEEDFWFLPPVQLKQRSEEEREREFAAELAIWEQIKEARDPAPIEQYLRSFPSGRFSELAQLRLDLVLAAQGEKKVEVVSSAENPFSKGSAVANTNRRVGDSYTYRVTDLFTKEPVGRGTITHTITEITESEVVYDSGLRTDLLGNRTRTPDGRRFTGSQTIPLEFAVGKRWNTRYRVIAPKGTGNVEMDLRVAARERITVPAGTFDTFRIEARGYTNGLGPPLQLTVNAWVAPGQVRSPIAREELRRNQFVTLSSERNELVSYRQG